MYFKDILRHVDVVVMYAFEYWVAKDKYYLTLIINTRINCETSARSNSELMIEIFRDGHVINKKSYMRPVRYSLYSSIFTSWLRKSTPAHSCYLIRMHDQGRKIYEIIFACGFSVNFL